VPDPTKRTDVGLWETSLIEAINADNEHPETPCCASLTYTALRAAPPCYHADVQLALEDFSRTGEAPLSELRADSVASRFTLGASRPAVLVARMTVPGGPWPGHYGLEGVVFRARKASFPGWFPTIPASASLDFATLVAASAGFSAGTGIVLFPEQLSVHRRGSATPFGLVFVDKLCDLFEAAVAENVSARTLTPADRDPARLRWLRELAFLGHEWGHACVDPQPSLLMARRRRPVAVISEIHADLAAIDMLLGQPEPDARPTADILVLDRILREAWLPRYQSQVDAIAARQLLRWLFDWSAVGSDEQGRTWLNLASVREAVQANRAAARQAEAACSYDDPSPAVDFLRSRGWSLTDKAFEMGFDELAASLMAQWAARWRVV
jgi:hypothetical protein